MPEETDLDTLRKLYRTHSTANLKDYQTFLSFPSISSESQHKADILACKDWLCDYIREIGLDVETWETPGHPSIFASWSKAGDEQPTLLIYNHYDVQPVDPLELWDSPPFTPTERDGEVYARGACDNKGQCWYVLQAIKLLLDCEGKLPINIKLIIEGEEEVGSSGLAAILPKRAEALRADHLAIVDLNIPDKQTPAITLGTRGITALTVTLEGSNTDLHSGFHGGMAYNPLHALAQIIAGLRDEDGEITVPGFYDDVVALSDTDRALVSLDFDEDDYLKNFGAAANGGEKKYSPLERSWVRPTLEVNGMSGGYTGEGFKTVIPAKAVAKLSCRTVPNQDPDRVVKLVAKHLQALAPEGMKVKIDFLHGGGEAVRTSTSAAVVKAFSQAYSAVFETECKYIFQGGSIPIIPELAQACGGDVVMMGLGLPGDKIHAPNEHFGIDRLELGTLTIAQALKALAN